MKIIYICLKNFASIFSAMKKKIIEIDFSKSKNRVILFVGENGSGKTSLLGQLHPFAYPGNMDIRNNVDLIIDGVDGFKEIHIEDGLDKYIIKHYYIYTKNGRNVKSFITKNNIELNPNGNVNSFKELITHEFGIELDYLKLLRLGSNVTNFIDMKAAERKNFLSEFLADIDIYTQFYKKINDDSKLLKSIIKTVSDKIARLKIFDLNDSENTINILQATLSGLENERNIVNNTLWEKQGAINTLIPEGIDVFMEENHKSIRAYKELLKEIENKEKIARKFNIVIVGNVESNIKDIESVINEKNSEIDSLNKMITFFFSQLDNLYSQKQEKENKIKTIGSDVEYVKINSLFNQLVNKKCSLDSKFEKYVPKCSMADIKTAISLKQEIDKFISVVYEFDADAIAETIDMISKGQSVDSIILKKIDDIDRQIGLMNNYLKVSANLNTDKVYILFKPPTCSEKCPYMNYYNDINGLKNSKTNLKSDIDRLENKREYYLSISNIKKNIDYILLLIKSNKELINKMPEDFFNISNLLQSIKTFVPFCDEERLTSYYQVLEDYDEYRQLNERIKDVKLELLSLETTNSSYKEIIAEFNRIETEILNIERDISDSKNNIQSIEDDRENLIDTLERYNKYNILLDEINQLEIAAESIYKIIEKNKEIETVVDEFMSFKKVSNDKINALDKNILSTRQEIEDINFKLKQYYSLKEELDILEGQYDDINILRESLSASKGIPLLFMQLYLKNTRIMVNNLLDIVFKGEFEIEEFEINDKEFCIPYSRNGMKISDISYTSQGEKSFVSISLSFALISQSIKKYNIMLLDEIDSTLSQKNRAMFLSVLEKQLESVDAEQVFLITHNNMFDNYPVDLILTSDVDIDNYRNMNIIYKN